jgi:glucosamine--fructose-6-phosphate aminotransferase (isomerizing)
MMGAHCIVFDTNAASEVAVMVPAAHPLIVPIVMLQAFYQIAEQTSRLRGFDPDRPQHLKKVTETT